MRLVEGFAAFALLLAGSGCAQLFGLDTTTGVDANVDVVSTQVERVSIGAIVNKGPQPLAGQTTQFLLDDGAGGFSTIDGSVMGDTFSGPLPGAPAALFTLPDVTNPQRLWDTLARTQRGNFIVYEHPNAQAPLPSSQLVLAVNLPSMYATGETFKLQSIGAWMGSDVTINGAPNTGVMQVNTTLDYSTFMPLVGTAKTRIIASDVTLLLRYTGALLTGVFQTQFEQSNGADGMTGTMIGVTADKTLMATIDQPGIATRYATVRPAVSGNTVSWRLVAAPGWSLAQDVGVQLRAAALAGTDTMINTAFGNPFEALDWKSVFSIMSQATRTYTFTDGTNSAAVTLSAAMSMIAEPGTTALALTMPAALPTSVTVNQTALLTDGMPLTLDLTKRVEVTAQVDRPGSSYYRLELVELTIDTSGPSPTLKRNIVVEAITTREEEGQPTFRLPPSLFTVGKTYYFAVRAISGEYADASAGDLQTVTLPRAGALLDSAVFTVMP